MMNRPGTVVRSRLLGLIAALVFTSAAAADTEQTVRQKGRMFSTQAVMLAPGEPIIFLNDDTVPHNIMSTSEGNAFDLGVQMPGTATPLKFTQTGVIAVVCAIHPRMHMTITVAQ
jgi:plastocyanin